MDTRIKLRRFKKEPIFSKAGMAVSLGVSASETVTPRRVGIMAARVDQDLGNQDTGDANCGLLSSVLSPGIGRKNVWHGVLAGVSVHRIFAARSAKATLGLKV